MISGRSFKTAIWIITFVLYITFFILIFFLDVEAINKVGNVTEVAFISGKTAIFGGQEMVVQGTISQGEILIDNSKIFIDNFRFDYLSFIGLVIHFITLVMMLINLDRKVMLLVSTSINLVSLIYLCFEPLFFYITNYGTNALWEFFVPTTTNTVYFIGMIVFVIVMAILDFTYYFRCISLFRKKSWKNTYWYKVNNFIKLLPEKSFKLFFIRERITWWNILIKYLKQPLPEITRLIASIVTL